MSTRRADGYRLSLFLSVLLLIVVSISIGWPSQAQPVRGRIISDVALSEQADTSEIRIEFSFPVRYVRHFPTDIGDTIQIQLRPVAVSNIDAGQVNGRESARLPAGSDIPLLDISYEGDLPGGPYLTVRFYQDVAFSIQQGVDFRSLTIIVHNASADAD